MSYLLIVSCVFPPEPVVSARLSADIYHALRDIGKEVKVFHPSPSRPNGFVFRKTRTLGNDEIIANSYTCSQSSLKGRFKESLSFGKAAQGFILEHCNEIEMIYANTWPLFGQYYLAKAAKKCGIPYYIHVQDVYPESYCYKLPKLLGSILKRLLLPIDKFVLQNALGVITISPLTISYLSETRKVCSSKFTLVRNWQDDGSYIGEYQPKEKKNDRCNVMYLGSVNPTANVKIIIKAFSNLDKSKFHLSIIGNGPDKDDCIELANQLAIDVVFTTIAPERVADKQKTADILVLCLKKGVAQTATPSKLTAYMLTGRPIIASVDRDSDCANIINEARCGLVVEPDNELALSDAINTLAQKELEELNLMGESAYKYAKNHLTKVQNLQLLINLLIS